MWDAQARASRVDSDLPLESHLKAIEAYLGITCIDLHDEHSYLTTSSDTKTQLTSLEAPKLYRDDLNPSTQF